MFKLNFLLLHVLPFEMSSAMRPAAESLAANFAGESDSAVTLNVILQRVGSLVLLAALLAEVSSDIRVNRPDVLPQSRRPHKRALALIALLIANHHPWVVSLLDVLVRISLHEKTGAVSFADKRFFPSVRSHVIFQH